LSLTVRWQDYIAGILKSVSLPLSSYRQKRLQRWIIIYLLLNNITFVLFYP
jgi:hypothetical protein